jgi:HSP20 family protein
MSIDRWDPFRDAMSLRDAFNRLFDETLMRPGSEWLSGFRDRPAMDVYQNDEAVTIEAHLPGIKREELEITISGSLLTIKGERHAKQELKEEHYLRREVHYGTFLRQIMLPEHADPEQATASFSDGVLKLVFPKQAAPQPRKIDLQPESESVTA